MSNLFETLKSMNAEVKVIVIVDCDCCGKTLITSDNCALHTKCIPRHWSKHSKGINNSRCKEFKHYVDPRKGKV